MRRIEFTPAEPLAADATLIFPVPCDTAAQRVLALPDLPRRTAGNSGQEVFVLSAKAGTQPGLTITFDDGFGRVPEAVWKPTGAAHETPSDALAAHMAEVAPVDLTAQDRVARIVAHVADRFTYGVRDVGLGDDRADMPALTCDLHLGTCVDTHSYAVACLRAAGFDACYVSGVWFPEGQTETSPGHCWFLVGAEGVPQQWEISHFLKFGLGPVRPVLNPQPGLRHALSVGRGLVVDGVGFTRLSGFATAEGTLLKTTARIVEDAPPVWDGPLTATVARLTPVPLAQRAAWREGGTHVVAHAEAPALGEVEVGGVAPAPGATGALRIVAWNVERLRHLGPIAQTLRDAAPDVSLLTEIDKGMARSGNSDRIADLADQNGQAYAYGVEFIELDRGDPAERAAAGDTQNAEGFHGNAILSRLALHRPALMRLEADGAWFGPARGQPRVGGRIALAGQVILDGQAVTVVAVHLESHSDPDLRAAQMLRLIDLIDRYDPEAPVVIGGDLNTCDGGPGRHAVG
jgi:endonuclease/exonuclease/phosphatase family metal-dependent hydrolase